MTVDFIGIGVQKSATTWLARNLRDHPDIWMPPQKELHYFTRSLKYPTPSFLATDNFEERMRSDAPHDAEFRKRLRDFGNAIERGDAQDIVWYERYLCRTPSDTWYRSLFEAGAGKVKGEITPAYSVLEVEDIQHIRDLFPELKIILLLRDPIERAWSQVRFSIRTGKLDRSASIDAIKAFIDSPQQERRGDYLSALRRWRAVFPPSSVFIGYYDEIVEAPKRFLAGIFGFLGVDPGRSNFQSLTEKTNVSPSIEIPEVIQTYLVEKYSGDIQRLAETLPSRYTKLWAEKYGISECGEAQAPSRFPKDTLHFLHIGKTGGSAIKHVLENHLEGGKYRIELHEHQRSLHDIPAGEKVFFILRDPILRFISGFYSRQRKGVPRYFSEWSTLEREVFETFDTPNDLAGALYDPASPHHALAYKAMLGVEHLRSIAKWFVDLDYFRSRAEDILFVGFQESLDGDFERFRQLAGLPEGIRLPKDDVAAHRNPVTLDRKIDANGIKALQSWYQNDYAFIDYCKAQFR